MDLWERIRNLPIDLQERILHEAYPHPLTRAAAQERRPLLTESRRLLRYQIDGAIGSIFHLGAPIDRERGILRQHWRRRPIYGAIKFAMRRLYNRILLVYNTATMNGTFSTPLVGPMYGPGLSRPDGLDHNRRGPAWHRPNHNPGIDEDYLTLMAHEAL
jgi:hypothetical protein